MRLRLKDGCLNMYNIGEERRNKGGNLKRLGNSGFDESGKLEKIQ